MKISTGLGIILNTAVVIGMIAVGFGAKAETTVTEEEMSIPHLLTFQQSQFPELHCLALNIYFEARSSNMADQYAVADVVLNRVEDTRYPNTICEVVQQGYKKGSRACQFSWYCDGKSDVPHNKQSWEKAQSIAWSIVKWENFRGITEGSTHYHTTYVNPRWNKSRKHWSITRIGRIGAHVYYRWN